MTQPSEQTPRSTDSTLHLHFGLEKCPTCGQQIPPDKIEEIAGRIAAREREQTLAISAQLEKQYAADKLAMEAKAQADLNAEREQSAVREQSAREEAQQAAEKLLSEKSARAEQERSQLVSEWEQKFSAAELERETAVETAATLQARLKQLQKENAEAVQAVRAEAQEREAQIRDEAQRTAESAVVERLAAMEAGHLESEAGLQARIAEAEASRLAAEQNQSTLASQLEELQRVKDAEVEKIREDATSELLLSRQLANQEAETRFREALATQGTALAEANARATDAEAKVVELTDQQASVLEANLKTQREVLEKDKENAEKARSFEENQKLSTKVADLQRALDNKTAEELGEGAEVNLFEDLKKEFPDDDIRRIPKGIEGADIIHVVMLSGKKCGTIIYDSKNHKQFRNDHVSKLRADQLAAHAEHAILSTRKFPQGTRQLHIQDGVLLANPARVVLIATIIRGHLLQLYAQRVSDVERESKIAALYDFMVSERCVSLLARIDERADDLLDLQTKEVRWHEANWKRQGEAIRAIQKAKGDLEKQVHSIIGTSEKNAAA